MRLLIIGGTIFLGRHIAANALACGHKVTLFHRGRHGAELFPEAEHILGDRDGALGALAGRRWDCVIDTCGYIPRIVRASAEALAHAVERYIFISTLSVYSDTSIEGITEAAAVGTLDDPSVEQITGATYGPLKALCEHAVDACAPGRALIIRPGLIVGPYDPSDRFTYWPVRVARGGAMLVPGRPERRVQVIDVRDLAKWTVAMAERQATGVYNAVGYVPPLRMGQLLDACAHIVANPARPIWIDEQWLIDREVAPWSELPLWVPESDPANRGFDAFDSSKAIAAGLSFRPVGATIRDTLEWAATRAATHEWRAGMRAEREAALLAEWLAQHGA